MRPHMSTRVQRAEHFIIAKPLFDCLRATTRSSCRSYENQFSFRVERVLCGYVALAALEFQLRV